MSGTICLDKKNDHSCKHGQREGFIDARAADDCYAFHSFPSSRRQCKSRRAVTLRCFGERGVKGLRYGLAADWQSTGCAKVLFCLRLFYRFV